MAAFNSQKTGEYDDQNGHSGHYNGQSWNGPPPQGPMKRANRVCRS